MLARVRDPSLRLVYLTILLLGVAYGLAISLVGVFLEEHDLGKERIGSLAVFFAAGIALAAVPAGWLIRRFSPKTVLATALVGYALAVSLFPFGGGYTGYAVARFFDGAFSVAVWVSSETVLLTRAPRGEKAFYTSLYAISLALGYVIGPLVALGVVAVASKTTSFVAAGLIAAFAAVLVIARLPGESAHEPAAPSPESPGKPGEFGPASDGPELGAAAVFKLIRASCLATFAYGYFQASVVLFLPLYLLERGITEEQTIIVPAFFAAGMLLFANVAARLGDRHGHLAVMRVLALIGIAAIGGFLTLRSAYAIYAVVFVAGAALASISPVSLALQGLVVPPRDLSKAGGFYNASYALGMLVGPPISGGLFERVNGQAMLIHFAALWALFVILTVLWRGDDPRLSA